MIVRRRARLVAALCIMPGLAAGVAVARQATVPTGAAYFVKSLQSPADRREARPDILDAPVLPGSVIKTITLVAALESQVIEPDTSRVCRRVVTVDGRRYVCSHPDLKRPLNGSEALAYSCNDFFVSLAPRLPRNAVNDVRRQAGLPPIAADANYAAALVGLDGPRVSPRVLLDVLVRLAGLDRDRPVAMKEPTRRVLLEGLRGAARFGTASALGDRQIAALAKTGTAPMPGGAFMGMVVALTPADAPARGIVVVAPGAAGLDAAKIAADVLRDAKQPEDLIGRPQPAGRAEGRPLQVRIGRSGANVTTFDLEDYIARVVAGEGEPRAAEAAQQALAITARTFAVANLNRHRREGYDFCDTTHCQVYREATDASRRAAQTTAGRILLHQGQPATVFYSALCGGRSELASNLWPGAVDYDVAPREDEACEDEPAWESEVRVDQVEQALRDAGLRGGRLRELRIVSRNASGRVARLRAEGFTPNEIAGHDFRMALGRVAGWQRVKSTAFEVRRTGNGFQLRGRGSGHGVGLCVIGAGRRAANGRTADEILRFYFPTLQVGAIPGTVNTRNTAAALPLPVPPPLPPARPAAETRADVRLSLPASEETERPQIVDLVRRARDQIAAAAKVPTPSAITVTVHSSVEAFGRVTGQPWWMSAATEGTAIELLPLTILRQRGQIERTIRHEVAHVLIDPVLKSRPIWVREGVAAYFVEPDAPTDPRTRISCPKDEEFLRPVSAGAHRAAYARAEACVRRAIAEGKSWREVK